MVWLWAGQALYVGAALDLSPHSGSVWCLAVGVDRPFTLRVGDGRPLSVRSALIPPRTTHQLIAEGGQMVFCYLDPASDRARSCRERMAQWHEAIGSRHAHEHRLTVLGAALGHDSAQSADERAAELLELAAPITPHIVDERIAAAARVLRDDPASAIPARELATRAGLSESRFLHLFRQELGTSLRRYRLWVRLMHAATLSAAGHNLTTVAAEAGFASPSHLADRFRTTFGLSATRLIATGVRVRTCPPQ
ncbi:helix-turn-helix domain-containing protein [Nocardia sp. NPDC127526]|uniref:AraC family transcriptional regulator n=1 Tax=Nocardia sp. NPDC127526 TaxID=3345393 RepID=UPI0036271F29